MMDMGADELRFGEPESGNLAEQLNLSSEAAATGDSSAIDHMSREQACTVRRESCIFSERFAYQEQQEEIPRFTVQLSHTAHAKDVIVAADSLTATVTSSSVWGRLRGDLPLPPRYEFHGRAS